MSIHKGLAPFQVPLTAGTGTETHGLVLSPSGEVLLRNGACGWRTIQGCESREHGGEAALSLGCALRAHGIEPLSLRWLNTFAQGSQGAAFYVIEEWRQRPGQVLSPELRFFGLEALPTGLPALERQALELLRVCWGWSVE